MCEPATVALLSIASAAASYAQASAAAADQNAYFEQNRLNTIAWANRSYEATNRNTMQEREASGQKMLQAQIAGLEARATQRVASAKGGQDPTGLNLAALDDNFKTQQARQLEAIRTNLTFTEQKNADQLDSIYHQAVSKINSVRTAAAPNPLIYGLKAASGVAGAYTKPGPYGGYTGGYGYGDEP